MSLDNIKDRTRLPIDDLLESTQSRSHSGERWWPKHSLVDLNERIRERMHQ